jgi:hypothetical protein
MSRSTAAQTGLARAVTCRPKVSTPRATQIRFLKADRLTGALSKLRPCYYGATTGRKLRRRALRELRMRILIVSNLYPPAAIGGYEIECAAVAEHLALRHQVLVLTSVRRRKRTMARG